jgi:hypothetical protein
MCVAAVLRLLLQPFLLWLPSIAEKSRQSENNAFKTA